MTSTHVIGRYLKQHYEKKCLCGGDPIPDPGISIFFSINVTEEDPDIVVLGFDATLTYEKLSKACHFIRNGYMLLWNQSRLELPIERSIYSRLVPWQN